MKRLISFTIAVLCAIPLIAQDSRSYRGLIRIPVELRTTDGIRIEKGEYETEVKVQEDHFMLIFRQSGTERAHVDGKLRREGSAALLPTVPLVGSSFMRSSADPIEKAQDRQFSKTGHALYEDEAREWKASMRVYKSRNGQDVCFEFQEKRGKGEWQTIDFSLLLDAKPNS